jgi:hypothetical protein
MLESLCQFGPIIALAGLHFGDARIFAALAGDADGRGGLRRLKTEAASTLAFGREIARTGSRRRLGEGRWRLLCRLGARRGLDRSIRSPRLPA